MGMAWERPPLHPIHPGMVSHNQEVLLLLVLAPPLGVKTTAAAAVAAVAAVSQVADLLQQLLEDHVSLNLQLEQLEIHLQVLQSLVT